MISRLTVIGMMALPSLAAAADLRVETVRYEGGAGQYQVAESQYVICDKCQAARRLASMPVIPPPPKNNAPEFLSVDGQIPIPASSVTAPIEEQHICPSASRLADHLLSPLATVYFALNDAHLRPAEKLRIRQAVAGGIESGVAVRVEGHTSREGTASYNLKLSRRRAQAVSHYLKVLGVPVREVIGLGKTHPKGGPLSKDRRAEIVIKEVQN